MWFAIGLLTLLGTVWFSIYWRLANRWHGKTDQLENQFYEYEILTHKGRLQGIKLGITCITGIEFCLKPETWVDQFFKLLGLSKEQQLEQLHFDENIYVISDDYRLTSVLKHNPDLPEKLSMLLDADCWALFRVRKLWCQKGRLWLEAKPKGKQEDSGLWANAVIELALPSLQTCRDILTQKLPRLSGGKDFFIFKAAVLVGISTALAVNGIAHAARIAFTKFPVVLDNSALWHHAMIAGGMVWTVLILLCIVWLGRTSRAHVVLLELVFIGSVGAVTSAYVELHDFNMEADSQPPQLQSSKIEDQYTTRCGKRHRSTCYHLKLAPWPEQPEGVSLDVGYRTYQNFKAGDLALVPVHHGALQVRWMDEPQPGPRW